VIAGVFDALEIECQRLRRVALHVAAPVTASVDEMLDMSVVAMSPSTPGESPAGVRQRREYAPRGHRQAKYAQRGAR
jgi:hypothetical protein